MDTASARALLDDERVRLQRTREAAAGMAEMSAEQTAAELSLFDQHPADTGSETFEREKDSAVLAAVNEQLAELDAAYARLDAGTFGVCEACGQAIDEERMRAFPLARLCMEDQRRAERSG